MVKQIVEVVKQYEQRLRVLPFVPWFSYGRQMLWQGASNRLFFTYLFSDQAIATDFLKDVGLLWRKVLWNICDRGMTWSVDSKLAEEFFWRCRRRVAGTRCRGYASIRHGSWFQLSNLTLQEVLLLTYDIVCREPALKIQNEYCFSAHTVTDCGSFCRETMLEFLEGGSEKIGGPNKNPEIDEWKFGRRKYHRGHPIKCHGVFGGVERKSGRTFLVPVPVRTANALIDISSDWFEPGTTVISDCWVAYLDLDSLGYTQSCHRVPHKYHRVHVAFLQGLRAAVQQGATIITISLITCSRRSSRRKALLLSLNSFILSRSQIGQCARPHPSPHPPSPPWSTPVPRHTSESPQTGTAPLNTDHLEVRF